MLFISRRKKKIGRETASLDSEEIHVRIYIYIYIKLDEEFMEGWGISRARAGRISSLNKAGNTLDRSIFMARGITRAR